MDDDRTAPLVEHLRPALKDVLTRVMNGAETEQDRTILTWLGLDVATIKREYRDLFGPMLN